MTCGYSQALVGGICSVLHENPFQATVRGCLIHPQSLRMKRFVSRPDRKLLRGQKFHVVNLGKRSDLLICATPSVQLLRGFPVNLELKGLWHRSSDVIALSIVDTVLFKQP